LIDRLGSRVMLTGVALALGGVVLLTSGVTGVLGLSLLITLTRGFGQSALSVVSLTMVGQWFRRRLSMAMAVYSVLLSVGFMLAFPAVGAVVASSGWRTAWAGIGGSILFGLAPIGWILVRRNPESCGLSLDGEEPAPADRQDLAAKPSSGYTLRQTLSTPAFWVFAMGSSVYGLIASGIALFNESILGELGFNANIYYRNLVITALTALIGNFLGGWLAANGSLYRLMTLAMSLLAASLLALPHLRATWHVAVYASVMGIAGGFVMVIFFSFWSQTYGRAHLGRIQGAAQTLTVLASAVGPLLLAECVTRTGSYATIFYLLALFVALFGIAAWLVPHPPMPIDSPIQSNRVASGVASGPS
jgi:MFS family permease